MASVLGRIAVLRIRRLIPITVARCEEDEVGRARGDNGRI